MIDTPKVVFTKTLKKSAWPNTVLAKGDPAEEIQQLKNRAGKEIIVYGRPSLVANLLKENLIDELNLFINPAAIGDGMRFFFGRTNLKLLQSVSYPCGIVVNTYQPPLPTA